MESESAGDALIQALLVDPDSFDRNGQSYELLQCYFDGFPLETLVPLLREEGSVQRAAIFVASELGSQAQPLMPEVIRLLDAPDRYIAYHVMEIIAVCSTGDFSEQFGNVVLQLESDDLVLRQLAMRLAVRAGRSQLEAARRMVAGGAYHVHDAGLGIVLDTALSSDAVSDAINDADALVRRYGGIAAKRRKMGFEGLLQTPAARADPDLQALAVERLRVGS